MKKIICVLVSLFVLLGLLSGCNSSKADVKKSLNIVTTIFPEYDWVMQILGDKKENADVTMLLDNGVDLHSYQPTANDILKLSTCDMFIYVGGESDEWVSDVLEKANNKNMVVVNLMDVLGEKAKEEEIVEGMEEEGEEEETAYDEHVWLSLKNAVLFCDVIADKISEIDTENKDIYKSNVSAYIEKLNALDEQYAKTVSDSEQKTVLFGDRFPFRYLTDDYGLSYYAAFVGCSAESEASFETIAFLANKVDELGIKTILTLEGTDHKIAETISKTAKSENVGILSMDSMQSTTSEDVKNGVTYISIMEKNLEVLKTALK